MHTNKLQLVPLTTGLRCLNRHFASELSLLLPTGFQWDSRGRRRNFLASDSLVPLTAFHIRSQRMAVPRGSLLSRVGVHGYIETWVRASSIEKSAFVRGGAVACVSVC